jgi:hypothetical protein
MRGRLIFNGNIDSLDTWIQRIRPWLFDRRPDPRVLIINAAWGRGEHDDQGLRAALTAHGVPSRWEGGFDQQVQNLSVWHRWREWMAARPRISALEEQLTDVVENTRAFYVEKTSFHAQRIRRVSQHLRGRFPGFRLGDLPVYARDELRPDVALDPLSLYRRALSRELVHDMADLVQNDGRMLGALAEVGENLAATTGLRFDDQWQSMRGQLSRMVLEADVILIPGGDPWSLLSALRFFDLGPVLHEALRQGVTLAGISAGTLVCCERIIIYDDNNPDPMRREFRLWDRGLGLVGGLQVLPHCMDRIHTDDSDNLAYLSRRFSTHVCAGLNEESFLLVDLETSTATSVGRHDAVHVFGPDGRKRSYEAGEALPMP